MTDETTPTETDSIETETVAMDLSDDEAADEAADAPHDGSQMDGHADAHISEAERDDADAAQSAEAQSATSNGAPSRTDDRAAEAAAQPAQQAADEYDGRAEAKRLIQASGAGSQQARIEDAMATVRDHLNDLGDQLQQLQQAETQAEQELEDLREAKAHLDRVPGDLTVTRTFAGGLTIDVPPTAEHHERPHDAPDGEADAESDVVDWDGVYDRDDYRSDFVETIDATQNKLASIRERQQTLENGLENAQAVARELQEYRDRAGDLADAQQPGGGQSGQPPGQRGTKQPDDAPVDFGPRNGRY